MKKVQPPKTETSKSAVIRLKEIKIYENREMYLKFVRPTSAYAEQVVQYKEDMLAKCLVMLD